MLIQEQLFLALVILSGKRLKIKNSYYFTKIDDGDIFLVRIHDKGQFCIVTREAEPSNSEIHHRQPVIIQNLKLVTTLILTIMQLNF